MIEVELLSFPEGVEGAGHANTVQSVSAVYLATASTSCVAVAPRETGVSRDLASACLHRASPRPLVGHVGSRSAQRRAPGAGPVGRSFPRQSDL